MFISPFRGSTIEFEWEKITLEERTLRDRTACLIPRVLIEGARSKFSCPSYFLLRLFTCIEGSILGRSNEQRARRWRATLSERCATLPAEGWHHRVCPLKRWKHVDRGWWPFFRSADPVLPTVKIFAWTKAFSRVYTPRTRPVLFIRGAQDQVFPGDRTQPLVAGPGKRHIRYLPPTSSKQFGNWPTRGTRRQGDRI